MLRREFSVSNLCRTSARDSLANTMRPQVAAVAATPASNRTSMFGMTKPMNDIVVQVGGANAGSTLSTNTTINSTVIMYARLLLSFIWAAAACRIGELIQINEHLHVKVEFMAIILGVLHGAMAKGGDAGVAHSTA